MNKSHFVWEFLCTACFEEWETDWTLGDDVTCPRCGAVYEAIWQVNKKGNIIGPWLGRRLTESELNQRNRREPASEQASD